MRKKFYIFSLSAVLLGVTGCATGQQSNFNVILDSNPAVESTQKDTTEILTPTPSVSLVETDTSQKADIDQKQTITVTNGLCEVLEQKDASLQAGYNSFNRMLSNDIELGFSGQSVFCVDESTGVVYFVNQGKGQDYYLYRLKDGEAKLAVAMPVKEIYTYQGSVYFMIDSYDMYELGELHNGDIYCYTPADGTVQLVYEAGSMENSLDHRLTVNEKGIYFSYYTIKEDGYYKYHYYYLPFGANEPIEDTEMTTWKGSDEYVFNYSLDEEYKSTLLLQSRTVQEDGTRETIQPSNRRIRFCVKGDYLYSAERTYISRLNLKTGEETKYDFHDVLQETLGEEIALDGTVIGIDIDDPNTGYRLIESFTVTETDIWVSISTDWYGRYNFETQEVSYGYLSKDNAIDEIGMTHLRIKEFYTDGKDVHVACFSREEAERVWLLNQPAWFARIPDVVEQSWTGDNVIVVEPLVK